MDAIATLPIFAKLDGARAVVAGGALPAVWKVELLAAAGARVGVYAPEPCSELAALAARLGTDSVDLARRDWAPSDFRGARIAVGALEGDDARKFRDAARRAGLPVNIVDMPELCDFQFGAIVARSPLMIGISTGGAVPVLGQMLRTRIEALLPEAIAAWAAAAQDWRPALRAKGLGFAARRRFWEVFSDRALAASERPPGPEDRSACLRAARASDGVTAGRLVLVGAGPGPAEMVTLAAVRALQSADIVVFEPSVPLAVLDLGRREARRFPSTGFADRGVAAATAWVEAGRTVVWCGPGDPGSCAAWDHIRLSFATIEPAATFRDAVRCRACPDGCARQIGR